MSMGSGGRVTLSEVARRAGTSTMAVSVTLNGARSNTRVSDATRSRILEIARDLNYTPNAMARSLKRQRTNTIGVLFNWAGSRAIHNQYSVGVLDGVVEGAGAAGYHVLLYTESWKDAETSTAVFADRRTDGVIVVAPSDDSDVVSGLVDLGIPIALVSSASTIANVPYVTIDNARGVRLALNHLAELGHTRIAYVGQGLNRHNLRERHAAFRAGMFERGFALPGEYVLPHMKPHAASNVDSLAHLLRLPNRPTAIFAANDDLAAEVMDSARAARLRIPEDVSVVGFDDILTASLTVPKLTTVRQPLIEIGAEAVRQLIRRINREQAHEHATEAFHVFAPELIVRASTAAPP